MFEKDKTALFEASRGEDGEIMFESTGDPLIDKWEKELAMGLTPDLSEGMSTEATATDAARSAKADLAREKLASVSGFDDSFEQGLMQHPGYEEKSSHELNSADLLGKG